MLQRKKYYDSQNHEITNARLNPLSHTASINGKIKKLEELTPQERQAVKYYERRKQMINNNLTSQELQKVLETLTDKEIKEILISEIIKRNKSK